MFEMSTCSVWLADAHPWLGTVLRQLLSTGTQSVSPFIVRSSDLATHLINLYYGLLVARGHGEVHQRIIIIIIIIQKFITRA